MEFPFQKQFLKSKKEAPFYASFNRHHGVLRKKCLVKSSLGAWT
jgi:hypothetical protein